MAGAVQSGVSGASDAARSGAANFANAAGAVGDTMRQSAAAFGRAGVGRERRRSRRGARR